MPSHADIRERLVQLDGADRHVDSLVLQACGAAVYQRISRGLIARWPGNRFDEAVPRITEDLGAARALIARVLPDFWVTSGLCGLSGHASIGPDYNGPAGERLRHEWPEAEFHAGFDADLCPGDGPHRECAALLDCLLQALERRP